MQCRVDSPGVTLALLLGPAAMVPSCRLFTGTTAFPRTGDADLAVAFSFLERVSLEDVRLMTAGLTSSTELD